MRGKEKDARVASIVIDLPGLVDRIAEVPVEAGNCAMLRAAPGRIFWLDIPNEGNGGWPEDEDEEREENASRPLLLIEDQEDHGIASAIDDYSLSPDQRRSPIVPALFHDHRRRSRRASLGRSARGGHGRSLRTGT